MSSRDIYLSMRTKKCQKGDLFAREYEAFYYYTYSIDPGHVYDPSKKAKKRCFYFQPGRAGPPKSADNMSRRYSPLSLTLFGRAGGSLGPDSRAANRLCCLIRRENLDARCSPGRNPTIGHIHP